MRIWVLVSFSQSSSVSSSFSELLLLDPLVLHVVNEYTLNMQRIQAVVELAIRYHCVPLPYLSCQGFNLVSYWYLNIKLICDAKDPVAIVVVVVGMEGLEEEVAQVKNISQLKLFGSMHLGTFRYRLYWQRLQVSPRHKNMLYNLGHF